MFGWLPFRIVFAGTLDDLERSASTAWLVAGERRGEIAVLTHKLAESERARDGLTDAGFHAVEAIGKESQRADDAERRARGLAERCDSIEARYQALEHELLEAILERDRLRASVVNRAARINELVDDARADAARIARLEAELEDARADRCPDRCPDHVIHIDAVS